jgi:arylsulfatase
MRGGKCTPYQGGTRSPAFFRWPAGRIPAGAECDALTAHFDLFPTLAEITGAKLSPGVKAQLEGRSLLPLLEDPKAGWPERTLVQHVGRWEKGKAAGAKYAKCSIRNSRFTLVNNEELYDLSVDPGEGRNVIADHPEVVAGLRAAYDLWWDGVQALLVNEDTSGFNHFSFRELYTKQFGAEATAEAMKRGREAKSGRKASDSISREELQKRRAERKKRKEQ